MDIFEFAMQMEKDGEKYYRELADKCGDKGLASIFNMLADAEVSHYNALKKMAEKTDPLLSRTELLKDVKNIFAQKAGEKTFNFDISQVDHYRKAQELEKKSEEFYLEKSSAMGSDVQKEILQKIAVEEKQHYMILENIIEFVSRPANWLENAEWHHLDKY